MELEIFAGEKLNQMIKATELLSKSKIIPNSLQGKSADIFSILVMGAEMGIPPMTALNNINVIQGKPTIGAAMMVALVRSKFPDALIKIEVDEKALVAKCTIARHQKDPSHFTSIWDMDRARLMGLAGKDNYKKQPATMLKWRAVSEAIRTIFPDVISGLISKEEAIDDDDYQKNNIISDCIEQDFPIPQEEKEQGPFFRIQNAKFRGLQLKDIDRPELEEYLTTLNKREVNNPLKEWEKEVRAMIEDYLTNYDMYQDIINSGGDNEHD